MADAIHGRHWCEWTFLLVCMPLRLFIVPWVFEIVLHANHRAAALIAGLMAAGFAYQSTQPPTNGGACRKHQPASWHFLRPFHAACFAVYALLRLLNASGPLWTTAVLLIDVVVGGAFWVHHHLINK